MQNVQNSTTKINDILLENNFHNSVEITADAYIMDHSMSMQSSLIKAIDDLKIIKEQTV